MILGLVKIHIKPLWQFGIGLRIYFFLTQWLMFVCLFVCLKRLFQLETRFSPEGTRLKHKCSSQANKSLYKHASHRPLPTIKVNNFTISHCVKSKMVNFDCWEGPMVSMLSIYRMSSSSSSSPRLRL